MDLDGLCYLRLERGAACHPCCHYWLPVSGQNLRTDKTCRRVQSFPSTLPHRGRRWWPWRCKRWLQRSNQGEYGWNISNFDEHPEAWWHYVKPLIHIYNLWSFMYRGSKHWFLVLSFNREERERRRQLAAEKAQERQDVSMARGIGNTSKASWSKTCNFDHFCWYLVWYILVSASWFHQAADANSLRNNIVWDTNKNKILYIYIPIPSGNIFSSSRRQTILFAKIVRKLEIMNHYIVLYT